jgi:O-acetyl-ADP-ribose deacetylase (regulator of RNase III)
MNKYQEVEGDLIVRAKNGEFNVVAHGANCFCQMGAGIAPQMASAFGCNNFKLEDKKFVGDINKLGQIDFEKLWYSSWDKKFERYPDEGDTLLYSLFVVNCYTQFFYGSLYGPPVDYEAIALCMRKINYTFKGLRIGLPLIGCGLAGGSWEIVRGIFQKELKDMELTVVKFKKL